MPFAYYKSGPTRQLFWEIDFVSKLLLFTVTCKEWRFGCALKQILCILNLYILFLTGGQGGRVLMVE